MTSSNEKSKSLKKPESFSSSLEANITDSGLGKKKVVPVPVKDVKPSPSQKMFVPPKTPIVPLNPFEGDNYDEDLNPFNKEEDDKNPFKKDMDADDDYDKNLNPFS